MRVDDSDFDREVLEAEGTVLVDFWAEWCGPCRTVAPLVEEIAEERGMKVAKVDVDANPKAPNRCGVRGLPTLMVVRDGGIVDTRVGALSRRALRDWIDAVA